MQQQNLQTDNIQLNVDTNENKDVLVANSHEMGSYSSSKLAAKAAQNAIWNKDSKDYSEKLNGGDAKKVANGEDSDADSDDEPIKKQIDIETQKIEDLKLFVTMCSAVLYCLTLTIVTGVYYGDNYRFTGQSPEEVECYACKTENTPVDCFDTDGVNVA